MNEPFEMTLLSCLFQVINGMISFTYADKFLQLKFDSHRKSLLLWTAIYAITQILATKVTDKFYPYNSFINIFPCIMMIFILQFIFFEKNHQKQIFVTASFVAGWEILRFLVSSLGYILYMLWGPFFSWLVNEFLIEHFSITEDTIEMLTVINRSVNVIIISICRVVQTMLLVIYLYLISRQFVRRDYELSSAESLFLIFPCITVLCIDLTVRLMAVSVNNGAIHLIYIRVPEMLILLPLVALMLLGIIIISVTLFRNIVLFKDEEQKRMLLENRVGEVHREIEKLTNIYSDIRGLRHDLRNHISIIAACIRKKSPDDEMNNYLNQMTQTVEKLDFFYKTGNPIIDMILHQSLQRARKKNIRFEANFHYPKNFNIDVYDLSIILNNALQNAIEACEKLGGGLIIIQSYTRGKFFFVEVENDFDGKLEWNGELPSTNKNDKHLHGIGLRNIRRCAQKYQGDIDIEIRNGKFNLTIMLCQNEE